MIHYIIPKYLDGRGNMTYIKNDSGESIVTKSVESVIRESLKRECIDIKEYRRKCQRLLNQKNLSPIYKRQGEILIPVKVRKAMIKRDGSHGYVNMFKISKIKENDMILFDGTKINFLDTERCIIKRLKMGKILDEHFKEKETYYRYPSDDMNSPATKEDIALLLSEVVRLKRLMER